jgi:WD40 repeat protein
MVIAPDGSWLATSSEDRRVRIWDTATGQSQAAMRVEDTIFACAWHGTGGLAAAGAAGLYKFDFRAGPASCSAKTEMADYDCQRLRAAVAGPSLVGSCRVVAPECLAQLH